MEIIEETTRAKYLLVLDRKTSNRFLKDTSI